MKRKAFYILFILLIMCYAAGCTFMSEDSRSTIPPTTPPGTVSVAPTSQSVMNTDTRVSSFTAYNLSIRISSLAVHSGPGYGYATVSYITDQGNYLIVAEEIEKLDGGDATVWGKISGIGWINLEDAQADAGVPSASTEPPVVEFEPYLITIVNPWLEIYVGPGYSYQGNGSIHDGGVYTIVQEAVQYFSSGRSVTWGKLKSGAGWICLDDAKLVTESGPPYRCTECGRADVYISRYALCDECYLIQNPAEYGYCSNCGDPLTYNESLNPWTVCDECPTDFFDSCILCGEVLSESESSANDSLYCFNCLVCGYCGDGISITDITAFGSFICWNCYEREYCCSVCGADCSNSGTIDGMCSACYENAASDKDYCTGCGVELNEWNTAYNGFGQCTDCYYKNLDPEYICDLCGADCSFRGSIEGLCEDCYYATHQDP